jgi:hypothetical protein
MAQHLYKKTGPQAAGPSPDGAPGGGGQKGGKDDVIVAEFEVKKKEDSSPDATLESTPTIVRTNNVSILT